MNDRILKSSYFPTDSAKEFPPQDCSHQISGNAVNTPKNQAHQTPVTGGVLPHFGIRPPPKPGVSHFITVPAGHNKLLYSSQTFPNLSLSRLLPEGPTISTHQVPQQVSSLPGYLMSQTQDQHVFGSPTGDHLPNFPPRYDKLPDNGVQLTDLNTPSFNFVEVRGENSGQSDDNPASGLSSSSRIPDSPVVGQLETDWGSSGQTVTLQGSNSLGDNVWLSGLTLDQPTIGQNGIIKPNQGLQSFKINLSPGMQELTQQHEANLDLSLYGSSGDQMELAKSEEISGYQPQSQYDPSQTSQFLPVVPQPTQRSPDHTGSSELFLPGRDKKYVPANIKHITFRNIVPDAQGSISIEPMSTATTPVNLNLNRSGSIDRRNIETAQSRVQNIRVKPLSKLVSSGPHLNEKPFIQQANSQSSNPSEYATGPTTVSSGGNHWMSQQFPEHRSSNIRQEHVPERTGFSTPKQEQDAHSVRVNSDQSAVPHLTDLSTNQQIHWQKPVQSVDETGNVGGQKSDSTSRNVLQPTGRDGNQHPITNPISH